MKPFQFKLWGFSTTRMALITGALSVLLCLIALFSRWIFHTDVAVGDYYNAFAGTASGSWWLALVFSLLPPYDKLKLYVCQPLMMAAFILIAGLVSL